ncbi:tail fiber assembly protein [Vibrio sp. CJQ_6]|uniref:tail fiber assembly protein n=1 Tax=Vibrio sp. CJQ_6 TaxID=3367165 RepID=UPI00370A0D23
MKYWTVDKETREVVGSGDTDKWNMPRNVLLIEPLPTKGGFAVIANADLSGTEYMVDFRGKTIYNKSASLQSKQVERLGEIEDSWTLKKPDTSFDVWDEASDNWQTDLQAQHEAELQKVTNIRESLYTQIVDRLNNEAKMIRRVEGNEEKAVEYEAQADAAYLKIRADNPWPIAPITE